MQRGCVKVKTMIVIGSGGHTTEMMKLVSCLSESYSPRHYILADTDKMSADKVKAVEDKRVDHEEHSPSFTMTRVRRSREVMQSWSSTLITTFSASLSSLLLVFSSRPDLLLCNGPGTCVPVCFAAFLSTVIGWKKVAIVFVESICRVRTLSLSGRLLYHITDEFFVQWPPLAEQYPLARFIGRFV
jgi:beta-1,4-N-acetylglucosaminyltransferase